ncbi:lysosome membrane protein 2-like isoform X1 [Watersipora subatra]|uniref:lysosome membrane protein 2-like isoform X1 n=1 Tax=Watersipora subatra TaxID=2589382 RepID=UPI00355BB25A
MKFNVIAAGVSGLIILAVGIAVFPIFNAVLHVELKKTIPLENSTKKLSSWAHPMKTSDAWIKFYMFDLANAEEVLNGGTPVFSERGPYVYDAGKVKENIVFQKNGTVSYRAPRTMIFNAAMSSGSENDTFTTINVPLYTIMNMLKTSALEAKIFSLLVRFIKDATIFRQLTVHEILWGYEDPLLEILAKLVDELHIKLPVKLDGSWGFFYKKNNSDTGLFNVYTGVDDLDNYMFINTWNKMDHVPFWKTEECNMINGTDGEVYHPFVDLDAKMYLFVADICRSIYLTYEQQVELEGIDLYRFTPPSTLWMYTADGHPENECFCVGDVCPHAGALNISSCQGGAPVFVSMPHFLDGEYYQNLVIGMTPDASKHSTYIDVEKTTGIVMEGSKRVQLNVATAPVHEIPQTKNIPELLFPVIWLDQAAAINEAGIYQFKHQFLYIKEGVFIAAYCLIALGAVLLLVSVIILALRLGKAQRLRKSKLVVDEKSPLINGDGSSSSTSDDTEDSLG